MIDVVFLLLIFFLCATRFKIPEGQLATFLPRDRGRPNGPAKVLDGALIRLAEESGRVFCWADDRELDLASTEGPFEERTGFRGPNMDQVRDHLRARKQSYHNFHPGGLPVTVDFGQRVPWKYVVDVVDILNELEINSIAFVDSEGVID